MSNTDLLSQAMSVNNLESAKGRTEDNDAESDCDDKLSGEKALLLPHPDPYSAPSPTVSVSSAHPKVEA